ncbi:MAG: hypothetical protein FWD34_02500 [Oscillospiraceae bacterium]|nr:hypothetical protein [Oscillospiraceae bacterium]
MIAKTIEVSRVSKKNLLLIEMIIVILFFALAAAGCVTLFAQAYSDGNYSRELTSAVIQAQNIAEFFKASGGDLDKTAELQGEYIFIGEDELWMYCKEHGFVLHLQAEQDGGLITGTVSVFRGSHDATMIVVDDRPVYSLEVAVFKGVVE